ncbi:hypothetical protein EON65_13115 [archaeon]|nr:MAG: hypothetical protein EON65_13115 [archaeon]
MSDEKDQKKERWYPGKYLGKAVKRASVIQKNDRLSSDRRSSSGYHEIEEDEPERGQSFVELPPDADDLLAPPNTPMQATFSSSTTTSSHFPSSPSKVKVRLLEVKYARFKDAKWSIRLDSVKVSNIQETQFPYERSFDLQNITSDIKIEIKGQSTISSYFNNGVIFIPVTTCLSFFGGVLPTLTIWKEIYPHYDSSKRCDPQLQKRLFSGLTDLPGSALPKPRYNLGFVKIEVELLTLTPNALGLYLLPPPAQEVCRLCFIALSI